MARGRQLVRRGTGFTYVAMLTALAIFGIGLAAVGESWSRVSQREREQELLLVGVEYARAIERYYQHSPDSIKRYPLQLTDLLDDTRFIGTTRYLRRSYRDPITNRTAWGLVRDARGGIMGIYSKSERATLMRQLVRLPGTATLLGERYCDWKFVYRP